MSNEKTKDDVLMISEETSSKQYSRRNFLGILGLGTAAIATASACRKDNWRYDDNTGINFGSGDIGILNYAYALEQLEAAFYTQVIKTPYKNISATEKKYLTDIRDHEIAHREFFKVAIASQAIPALQVDFSTIDFSNRKSVLATAQAFEDLGVSAYNGAGGFLKSSDYLLIAGKIVSVEARHAALIREIVSEGSFADMSVVDKHGLDVVRSPQEVLKIAGAYIKTKINTNSLPKS